MRFGECSPKGRHPAFHPPGQTSKEISQKAQEPFPLGKSTMNYSCSRYELKCNECGKRFGNQPLSACPDCLAPLEIVYDLEAARDLFTKENIAAGPASIWRYAPLLPIP